MMPSKSRKIRRPSGGIGRLSVLRYHPVPDHGSLAVLASPCGWNGPSIAQSCGTETARQFCRSRENSQPSLKSSTTRPEFETVDVSFTRISPKRSRPHFSRPRSFANGPESATAGNSTTRLSPSGENPFGATPPPIETSSGKPKRSDLRSMSAIGLKPFSALMRTRQASAADLRGRSSRSRPGFSGIVMFFELWASEALSSHFATSMTAKFAWTARPYSSWKTFMRSYLNQLFVTGPESVSTTAMPGVYASPGRVSQLTPSGETR